MDNLNLFDFSGLKITLASPDRVTKWSHGEVTKPETINYRTFRAEKDGLFDERIFGPTKDYECYCGKYKRMRYKGIVCDRCGVEITTSAVRRERMGHIKLASPIAHIWYFKGSSSVLSIVLDIPPQSLERIIYYALYLVMDVNHEKQKQAMKVLTETAKEEIKTIEEAYKIEEENVKKHFTKEKDALSKKITNHEQLEITRQEFDFKEREQLKLTSNQFAEKKTKKTAFFDRITKLVRSIKPFDVIEEDDYLFLKEKNIENFLTVGMGSEALYDILSEFDINKQYADSLKTLTESKGEKRNKLLKKVRALEAFIKAKIDPKWMVLTVLPVIPPDLRPVVQLPGGKFATSDLNDFYRRVINRNNRLKQLIDLGAPEIILRNEKRMLQEAVDSLIDLQKSRGRSRGASNSKVQKSLSDILRGKQGRFRQNLLGKRVDYSGRSTIIVGPELNLDQVGLPKEMALELFKPFLLHEIIIRGLAPNIKSAKNYLEKKEPVVYDILEEITKDHPVLLNRAPTLHKLSVLGFYPVLTDGHAIKLHPTVCAGYNADFDGDAMGVFLPLSKTAIEEVKNRMLPYHNLLKPADGSPIVLPNKEMALGCYYLTTMNSHMSNTDDKNLKAFSSEDEALNFYQVKKISLREPIFVRIKEQTVKTTIGRIIFNQTIPDELKFINNEVKASDIKNLVLKAMKIFDRQTVGKIIDKIKEIGFWAATISGGLSVSVFDCEIIQDKDKIIEETEKEIEKVRQNFDQGLLTVEEKKRYSNKLWIDTTEKLADKTWAQLDDENPVKIIIKSGGARASREQLKQLSAMKGLVVDPLGKIIEVPTKSNYRQGLSIFEYVISARGARKGLTDSALKTADAGYLTRRLVDVAHDMIIREDDCKTEEGLTISTSEIRGDKFLDRIKNRYTSEDVYKNNKVIIEKNTLLDQEKIKLIEENGIEKITVRSPLFCHSPYGVCQKCYGTDLSTNKNVDIGVPVGVIAAQSVGEPGTQLTMRVRHFGGIVISDVTQGLPRVEELFETRTPKIVSPIAEISGTISVQEDTEKEIYSVKIASASKDSNVKEQEFVIPISQKLKVKDGDLIASGTALSEGYLDVNDVLAIKGLRAAQIYLLDEIQKVYESQGIAIHDKHFEVIIRKMSDKVIIEDEGDTSFIKDEVVSKIRFEEENKKALAKGQKPATGKISILGITRAAIYTDSWLSAASFEQTTNVLSSAAIKGQADYLLGLKENVIIGRLIPVTGELIDKYYGKFVNKYADNQPTDQEGSKKED